MSNYTESASVCQQQIPPHKSAIDLGFEKNRDGIFYYAPAGEYAIRIIKKRTGYKLGIWQRRWKGVYYHRHLFTSPEASALYAFDFLKDWQKHGEVAAACHWKAPAEEKPLPAYRDTSEVDALIAEMGGL